MAARQQSPEHVAFGAAVREVRARRVQTQETLGFASGMHRNYIGAIERGEINPTFNALLKLRTCLGVDLTELIRVYERNVSDPRPPVQRPRRTR